MISTVSVIILSYNNGEYLFETLSSVLKQDYPSIELIVSDDCSVFFDENRVRSYIEKNNRGNIVSSRINIWERNEGTVRSLNKSIQLASGDYIKIIAGDDVFADRSSISMQISTMSDNDYISIGNIVECDKFLKTIKIVGYRTISGKNKKDSKAFLKYLVKRNNSLFSTQALCFKKDFFTRYGLYDERFVLIEDLPMMVKIVTSGIRFSYVEYPIIKHRGDVGVSASSFLIRKARIKYYSDLMVYFDSILQPIDSIVGKAYVKNRFSINKFRVEYVNNKRRFFLVIRNMPSLAFYVFSTFWDKIFFS